ncbi:MAG: phage tail spike protein [Candidatus Ventricola sp.]
MKPVIYNREVVRQGTLRHAHRIGYKRVRNDLHTASFDLPVQDDDVLLCENTHYIVGIYDGDRYIDKFRITSQPQEYLTGAGAVYRYSCDHVISFLADCRIDGYLEIGGTGVSTRTVLETLLARQNEEWGFVRWKLGRCDFDYQMQYGFENTDVLNAMYSVPKCFLDEYLWTFDTTAYPWTVNLIRMDTQASCMIQFRRNLKWIKRTKDVSNLCTRLYCLGSGEGVNQTNIKRLTGGVNYIESATKSKHGVIAKHLIDRSISDDELLYAKGRAMLAEIDEPRYSYVVGGIDLHRKTGLALDLMDEGRMVRVQDEDAGIDFTKPILSVEKKDVECDPLGIEITISNKADDVSSTIENLSARAAITAQYSQGATNLFPMQVTDNADADHPARLRFYVPETCAKINAVKLSWQFSQFRAYETGAEAGGGDVTSTMDGGGGEKTSSSGGSYSKTIPEKTVSVGATGGPMADEGSSALYTEANESGLTTSTKAAFNTGTPIGTASGAAMTNTGTGGPSETGSSSPYTDYKGEHNHTVSSHTHSFSDSCGISHNHSLSSGASATGGIYSGVSSVSISGTTGSKSPDTTSTSSHRHTVNSHSHSVEQHSHGMNHYHSVAAHSHTISSHTHKFNHWHKVTGSVTIPEISISIPSHSHTVEIPAHSHSVTIPDHTHDIVYGIYEGGMAESISISVDGNDVPSSKLVDGNGYPVAELDVVGYMDTDDDGRITRGTWHEIELTPDSLTRIEAFLFVQTFVRSYSGGEY